MRELFLLFTKLGFVAFGGPAAHVAMMRQEVVTRRGWMGDQEFLDLNGATNLIPGPNSTELAIHIGRELAGWRGLLVAGTCFIVPATMIVLAFAIAYKIYGSTPAGQSLLYGITPVVVAVIIQALWGLLKTAVKGPLTAAVGTGALLLYLFAGMPEIPLLFGAALLVFAAENARRWWGRAASMAPLGIPLGLLAAAKAPAMGGILSIFWSFLKIGSVLFGSGYVLLAFLRSEFVGPGACSREGSSWTQWPWVRSPGSSLHHGDLHRVPAGRRTGCCGGHDRDILAGLRLCRPYRTLRLHSQELASFLEPPRRGQRGFLGPNGRSDVATRTGDSSGSVRSPHRDHSAGVAFEVQD